MNDESAPQPQPSPPHYWSMEHYGFADHPGEPAARTTARDRLRCSPRRARLIGGVAAAVIVLSGLGGFAAAQATADPDPSAPSASVRGVGGGPQSKVDGRTTRGPDDRGDRRTGSGQR